MPTTSETTTTSTTSTTDPEFEVLQAFDEFFAAVEEYEEEHWEDHEAAKAKEVAPSAWAGDLQAFAVAREQLDKAKSLVDPSVVTPENFDALMEKIVDKIKSDGDEDGSLRHSWNILNSARSRIDMEGLDELYKKISVNYLMVAQNVSVPEGSGFDTDLNSTGQTLVNAIDQMNNDAKAYKILSAYLANKE